MSGSLRIFAVEQLNPRLRDQAREKLAAATKARDVRPLEDGDRHEVKGEPDIVAGTELREQAAPAKATPNRNPHKRPDRSILRELADKLRIEDKARGNKYRAQAVFADGHRFGSRKEYHAYLEKKIEEQRGVITDLRVHVKFALYDPGDNCRGELVGTYTSDLTWKENGKLVVADVKSHFTKTLRGWERTKSLMKMCHGHEVIELGG